MYNCYKGDGGKTHAWGLDLDKEREEGLWEEVILNSRNVEMKQVKIAPDKRNCGYGPHHWKEQDDHEGRKEYQSMVNT